VFGVKENDMLNFHF